MASKRSIFEDTWKQKAKHAIVFNLDAWIWFIKAVQLESCWKTKRNGCNFYPTYCFKIYSFVWILILEDIKDKKRQSLSCYCKYLRLQVVIHWLVDHGNSPPVWTVQLLLMQIDCSSISISGGLKKKKKKKSQQFMDAAGLVPDWRQLEQHDQFLQKNRSVY